MNKLWSPTVTKFLVFLGFIILTIVLGGVVHVNRQAIDGYLESVPFMLRLLIFVALYIMSNLLIGDFKDILKIVGAFIFGVYISAILIYIAEIVSSVILFHASLFLGKEYVEIALKGKTKRFYVNASNLSWPWLFCLRFFLFLPFRVLDLSFGLTGVPFHKYFLAVITGSPLRIFTLQFLLVAIGEFTVPKITHYFQNNAFITLVVFIYAVCSIIFIITFIRKLR